ncbi:MAG: hypothetical protein ACLFSL_04750 [Candidatus Woesearchaeota archaeon]
MILTILLVIARLASALYLFVSGFLLLFDGGSKRSAILWGGGLVFWSSAVLVSIFSFDGSSDVSMAFYGLMRVILLVAFVLMLMRGTLGLLLPKAETNILILAYGVAVLILDYMVNPLISSQYDNFALHSVYLKLPLAIVFFFYFYTYYMELKDARVLWLASVWSAFFIIVLLYILANSMGLHVLQRIMLLISYINMILIAFAFNRLRESGENWNAVTAPKKYVVDSGLTNYLTNDVGVDGNAIVEKALSESGYSRISMMPVEQQRIFIDNLVNSNFPDFSKQKKSKIKTRMMDILGLKLNIGDWDRS